VLISIAYSPVTAADLDDRAVRVRSEYASAGAAASPPEPSPELATPFRLISAAAAAHSAAAVVAQPRISSSSTTPVTAIVISNTSGLSTLSSSALAVDSKRAYPCRFCSAALSSSSNRLRHERAKHQPQLLLQESSSSVSADAAAVSAAACDSAISARPITVAQEVDSSSSARGDHEPASAAPVTSQTAMSVELPASHHQLTLFSQELTNSASQPAEASSSSPTPLPPGPGHTEDVDVSLDDVIIPSTSESESDCHNSGSDFEPESDPATGTCAAPAAAAQLEETPSSAPPPPPMDLTGVEGVNPSLQETDLQTQCYPFLCWLTEPPLTPCEALVKARRIKMLSQLQPIKNTLRFIFVLLYEHRILAAPELKALSTLSVCQQLYSSMQARQAGHARLHAIFLLVKKILVFLSSKESAARRQFLLPSSVSESYLYVDGICSDSSFRRKQEARNRSLLGVAASKQLHRTQAAAAAATAAQSAHSHGGSGPGAAGHSGGGFQVPQTWSFTNSPATAAAAINVKMKVQSPGPRPASTKPRSSTAPSLNQQSSSRAAMSARSRPSKPQAASEVSANEMTASELQQVAQGCILFLQQHSVVSKATTPTSASNNVDLAPPPGPPSPSAAAPAGGCCTTSTTAALEAQTDTVAMQQVITSEQLQQAGSNIAEFCSNVAQTHADAATAACKPHRPAVVADHVYMAYLITAILCLCMAPRSQVLRQMRIGSSVVKEADGKYWVRLLADMCKNGKPTLFAVPELLTPVMDHYLQQVRPRMLARQPAVAAAAAAGSQQQAHDYFFCKSNGTAPRAEFSTCTSLVTTQLIGRAINAHAFRSAVITTFYRANASQADMDTLANIMSHDATTARNYYYRPAHMRAAEDTSQRMIQQLLPAAVAAAADAHAATSSS